MTHSTREKDYDNENATLFCPRYFLYINSFGDVYPCCHQILSMRIGNVCDYDIYEKIINYKPNFRCKCSYIEFDNNEDHNLSFLNINLELAGECNGSCVYCFQKNLPTFKKSISIYKNLEKLLHRLKPQNMMVFGGEIGVQKKTIELLQRIKSDYNTTLNVATNGNINNSLREAFNNMFESIQVTFNGFCANTVKMLSGLDFHEQTKFCEQAINSHPVSVKFIITPLSLLELPLFLQWALDKPFQHVIIDAAFEPSKNYSVDNDWGVSMLSTMVGFYWDDIFVKMSKEVKSILMEKAESIVQNNIVIMFSNEVEKRLEIDMTFYDEIKISGQLKPKNVCISHKAWRSLIK